MGEFWSLTKEERKRIVEIVAEEARGKCGVIAQTGSTSAHETVELTRHAEEAGADFVIMMTPFYPHTDEAMVYDWFAFVAARVNIGIWLFDTPYSGRPAISPATTARLAQIENICGAKIARPLEHYLAVQRLCGDKIVMSSPSETDFLMMMRDHGQKVHQSSASPYLIQTAAWQPMRDYTELALAGPVRRSREGFGDAERGARGRQALAARTLARHPRVADRRDQGVVGDARHGGRAGAHAAAADERARSAARCATRSRPPACSPASAQRRWRSDVGVGSHPLIPAKAESIFLCGPWVPACAGTSG